MMKRFILLLLAMACMIPVFALSEDEVRIVSVDATSWIVGSDPSSYIPSKMIDGDETTSFQFSTKTTPLGQEYIYFYLGAPSDIRMLWIKNGFWRVSNGNDQYIRNSRVKTMTVDFQYSGTNGYTDAVTVTLPDDTLRYDWTKVDLGMHSRVISVRFLIRESYVGSVYPNDVCISEVRFTNGSPSVSTTVSSGNLYGLASQKLATRYGPGTQYEEGGTYNVAGQYIRILSRAWDKRNSIWWVKCEIPYKGDTRVLWTGYKRFDSSTIPLESIPIEGDTNTSQGTTGTTTSTATEPWVSAYRQFFTSGTYKQYIQSTNSEWAGMLNARDTQWDTASLYDMDANGIPELIIRVDYGIEQADIFTYSYGQILWLGTMGGDNFFQDMFYYPGSSNAGLLAAMGGPAMKIWSYKLVGGRFTGSATAETIINADGDDTIGVRMNTNDNTLHNLLWGTFVGNQDTSVSLPWYRSANLQRDDDWAVLWNAVRR